MKEEDYRGVYLAIIKIVEELFEKEIDAFVDNPLDKAEIIGKEQFFSKLKNRLKDLFDDNDLSK